MVKNFIKEQFYLYRVEDAVAEYVANIFEPMTGYRPEDEDVASKLVSLLPEDDRMRTKGTVRPASSLATAIAAIATGNGAVGLTPSGKYVAEINMDGTIHVATFDEKKGLFKASTISPEGKLNKYKLKSPTGDGEGQLAEVLTLALIPTLLKEQEFKDGFDVILANAKETEPDVHRNSVILAKITDNAVARMTHKELRSAYLVDTDTIISAFEDSESCEMASFPSSTKVKEAIYGEFTSVKMAEDEKPADAKDADINGIYRFGESHDNDPRIPIIDSSWVIPQEAHIMGLHASKSPKFRNFGLRGGAGSGKSQTCRILAGMCAKPFGIYTCSANTEIFDLLGQIMPYLGAGATTSELTKDEVRFLNNISDIGGFSGKNVAEILGMPKIEDCLSNPVGVVEMLTGSSKTATAAEAMNVWSNSVGEKLNSYVQLLARANNDSPKYMYSETPFMQAIRNGEIIELQEPNVIINAGVMVGLNGIMEPRGSVVLPTGERVFRHPDSIVTITTNVSYEGCRDMNAALLDRLDLVFDVETPDVPTMVDRVIAQTGFTDRDLLTEMATIVQDIAAIMSQQGIEDGTAGLRSLISWAESVKVTNDPYMSAMSTLIAKTTSSAEDRNLLAKRLSSASFAGRKRGRKI